VVFDLEEMHALEAAGQSSIRIEPEHNSSAGHVRFNSIAHGAVTSYRSRRERSIEPHSRPAVVGPEKVVFTRQAVNK
jgi:hypothetical protein